MAAHNWRSVTRPEPPTSCAWCELHALRLFDARRTDIEVYARQLEALGRAKATIARADDPTVGRRPRRVR